MTKQIAPELEWNEPWHYLYPVGWYNCTGIFSSRVLSGFTHTERSLSLPLPLLFSLPLPRVQFAPQQIAANTPGMSGCGGGNTAPAYHYIMNKYGNNPLGGLASEHFCPYTQSMWQGCSQSACTNQYVDVKDIWIYMDMNTRMMNMDDVERGREFTTDRSEDEEMETCVCVVRKYVLSNRYHGSTKR